MSDPAPLPQGLHEEILRVAQRPEPVRAAALTTLCQQHPEHAPALRQALATLGAAEPPGVQTDASAERLAHLRAWLRDPDQRYTLRGEVGRGGMGAVFKVSDQALGRHLAMKVIRLEGDEDSTPANAVDPRVLERFLEEAQITGQLDHPGIVPVHELGVDAQGRAYFTMKLVRGHTADEVFAAARAGEDGWSRTRALEVVVKVCDALAFAHEKGVIHRDLKPRNVMVGRFGEVFVMDWGLAKVLGQKDPRDLRIRPPDSSAQSRVRTDRARTAASDPDSPLVTMDGAVVGTPCFMAPEQAEGRIETLGPTSDVYAVGAMLYTLLTGWQPYCKPGARVSPYTVLQWVQNGPPKPVHEIDPTVPAELAAICAKAMARAIADRYPDMKALGEDLRAYLESRVVKAWRTGALAEMRMWVQRNRAVAAVAAALALVAVGAFVWISVALKDAREARREVERKNKESRWELYVASVTAASAAIERNEISNARRLLEGAPEEHRAWEWRHFMARIDNSLPVLRGHEGACTTAVFSPDGSRVLTASWDKTARLWDSATGRELAVLRGHEARVSSVSFSPDGSRVVTASWDSTARLWDPSTGRGLGVLAGHEQALSSATFSPDSSRVLTASNDKTARLWDPATGRELTVLRGHDRVVSSATFSPGGSRVLTVSRDCTARLWDPATGRELAVLRGHEAPVSSATLSPDGSRVLTASEDKTARLWDPATGRELAVLRGHDLGVSSATFSPDGSRVLTASEDKTARLWDPATGRGLAVLRGHEGIVSSAIFSPDGSRILTASQDKTVRLWDPAASHELAVLRGHEGEIWNASFGPDGSRVLTASQDRTARLWDPAIGPELAVLRGHEGVVSSATLSPDGSRVLTASRDGTARLWDAATARELAVLRGHEGVVTSASFSPDGSRALTASWDKTARLWDPATGRELTVLRGHEYQVWSASFSPDGSLILTASQDLTARLWDPATGRKLGVLRGHENQVSSATFSPDGSRVLTASWDRTARLWDPATGRELAVLRGHEQGLVSATFSPDGSRILTASWDRTARLWDPATGRELAVLRGHEDSVLSATFSPDGSRVLTASKDRTARLWDPATGRELAVLRGHEDSVSSATFSPDGSRVLTASEDKTARLWHSVPYRQRHREVEARRSAADEATKLLDRLGQSSSPESVARRIHEETGLDPVVRRVALDLLLTCCQASRDAARRRVDELRVVCVTQAGLVRAMAEDASLDLWARDEARILTKRIGEDTDERRDRMWKALCLETPIADRAQSVLRAVERIESRGSQPDHALLGAAQSRCGLHAEAITTLTAVSASSPRPRALPFLAMSHHHLGQHEQAEQALAALEKALAPFPQSDLQPLLAEVRALIRGK